MSKIKSYTPAWLTKPAPGHTLFAVTGDDLKASSFSPYYSKKKSRPGPRRTIARRGTEVFVAVGREIRWGDLVYLKESWEEKSASNIRVKREYSNGDFEVYEDGQNGTGETTPDALAQAQGYRTLKTPAADEIRQLVISPNSNYLAVLTTHTIHICVLPASSALTSKDTGPLKPKFFTLGPTTHVTSRSAIMSALWHPLGVDSSSVVTVTEDAVVRVWEISPADRWSFDTPTLSIDLRKLADGTYLDQDFTASASATSTAFSPDSFDMEVAAASFAVRGSGRWSSMTLFVAMRGGDAYALCPLLPKRWAPPPMLIPSLSVSIVAKLAAIEDDPQVSPQEKLLARQQLDWMSDLDNQEPRIVEGHLSEPPIEIYQRPSRPGVIPMLQGPLDLDLSLSPEEQDDLDIELTDIYVIGRKMDTDDLMNGEDEILQLDENEREGLSLSAICLLSTSGQLRICLDVDGVEARWLPPRTKSTATSFSKDTEKPSLLTFETLDILRPMEVTPDCWPVFGDDVKSRYSFFISHHYGVDHVSLSSWVFRLEDELNAESGNGAKLRISILANSKSSRRRVYTQAPPGTPYAACVAIRDPDLGYFVLSATSSDPVALVFDDSDDEGLRLRPTSLSLELESSPDEKVREVLDDYMPRPIFQPPSIFEQPSEMSKLLQFFNTSKYGPLMRQVVRLSPAMLRAFSFAHQVLSLETGKVNEAVAELFRRCETLRLELKDQIVKANELKRRIEHITGEDVEMGEEAVSDETRIARRLVERKQKQVELAQRLEKLKKRLSQVSTRELSDKESAWVDEVKEVESGVMGTEEEDGGMSSRVKKPWRRLEEAKSLKEELLSQVGEMQKRSGSGDETESSISPSASSLRIPSDIRKAKVAQVKSLLERETALVDAVKIRLGRLSVG